MLWQASYKGNGKRFALVFLLFAIVVLVMIFLALLGAAYGGYLNLHE